MMLQEVIQNLGRKNMEEKLKEKLEKNKINVKTCPLTLTGHSLGAGIAVLLSLILRCDDNFNFFRKESINCYAFAPPACVDFNLATRVGSWCTSLVMGVSFALEDSGRFVF